MISGRHLISEKQLDKIRKLKSKGQLQKARNLAEEALRDDGTSLELMVEVLGFSFQLDSWTEALNRLKAMLAQCTLGQLCGGPNRQEFMRLVHDCSGFRAMLTEHLLSLQDYNDIGGWIELVDKDDRQWLLNTWLQLAKEALNARTSAALVSAVGVALFVMDDWENAWQRWQAALRRDPRLLKKIMGYFRASSKTDLAQLSHRLKLIKLIAASGKRQETVSLLQALGLESQENAQRVLVELPEILAREMKTKEVLALRFALALHLRDREILAEITEDLGRLAEDDIFALRKQAMLKISDSDHRRDVLLAFVRVYIEKKNWENAALLLKSLHEEGHHPDIIVLMERVLAHYPIMPQLHYVLGKHYLDSDDHEKARDHLLAIQQVEEYRESIRELLEDRLAQQYNSSLARMLLNLINPASHKAGLIAWWIVMREGRHSELRLEDWSKPHFHEKLSPFWRLALIHGWSLADKYDTAYDQLCDFLDEAPDLAPEALRPAERICQGYKADLTRIVKSVERLGTTLVPARAWAELGGRCARITEEHRSRVEPDAPTPARAAQPDRAEANPLNQGGDSENPDLNKIFMEFRQALTSGNMVRAAEIAETTVERFPEKIKSVVSHLERLDREHPRDPIWSKTILRILVRTGTYAKAITLGQYMLNGAKFQQFLPEVYQMLAQAYEGSGHHAEALRFFCLSSRNVRFYHVNRTRLVAKVLPNNPQLLKEVLQLVLMNEDEAFWGKLMKAWYEFRPGDIEQLIKAQIAFADQMGSPRSLLNLAYWYLQASQPEGVNATLNRIDLKNPDIREPLVHMVGLINLKYADSPKPKFLLARFYLIHRETAKAVETLRGLSEQSPQAAETIFSYLRKYLKENPDHVEIAPLFGLVIRIALDYGAAATAIQILEELGRQSLEDAKSLLDGVMRVIQSKESPVEAYYNLAALLHRWNEPVRLLDVLERANLGTHMAHERLAWLEQAKTVPSLKDRATLAGAHLLLEQLEFEKSARALMQIESMDFQAKAHPLYEKLVKRFPDRVALWIAAGWAAFFTDKERAMRCFRHVRELENASREHRIEAFAALYELGQKPDYQDLVRAEEGEEDQLLADLGETYRRIREMELLHWRHANGAAPAASLGWLIAKGDLDRFEEFRPSLEELTGPEKTRLNAALLAARGEWTQAAWHFNESDMPLASRQSYFYNAGLLERAVHQKKPGTRLPAFIKRRFLDESGHPKKIVARFSSMRNMKRLQRLQYAAKKSR